MELRLMWYTCVTEDVAIDIMDLIWRQECLLVQQSGP